MSGYIKTGANYVAERLEDKAYAKRDKVAAKWQPIDRSDGTCGNISYVLMVKDDGKIARRPANKSFELRDPTMGQIMPSAMWLYRLACTFAVAPDMQGPEGYKCVWHVTLQHKESGKRFTLYDYKAGFSVGSDSSDFKADKEFIRDAIELLNYLASDACVHPYDGTAAGSVA